MPTYKVSELEGQLLDVAVMHSGARSSQNPSTDTTLAWGLMQRHRIDVFHASHGKVHASIGEQAHVAEGPDELIAIMRCFVMLRWGEGIDLPAERLREQWPRLDGCSSRRQRGSCGRTRS